MRYITSSLLLTSVIFLGCSKNSNEMTTEALEPVYKIGKMEFFQSESNKVDSIFTKLDTTIHINNTSQVQADFTYAPYDTFYDSLSIMADEPAGQKIKIQEGLYIPNIIIRDEVFYTERDSLYLTSFSQNYTMPLNRRMQFTETIKPTPKSIYEMTGEYWMVKFTVNFKAQLINLLDNSYSTITGKIRGTRVATGYKEGQVEQPRSIIIIAKPVESKP